MRAAIAASVPSIPTSDSAAASDPRRLAEHMEVERAGDDRQDDGQG
jgi:hypothetical protein